MTKAQPIRFKSTFGRMMRGSWDLLRRGGTPLLASILVIFLLIWLLVLPLVGWLFREALRSAGMVVVDMRSLHLGGGLTISALLLLAIVIVAFWAVSTQLLVTVLALRRAQVDRVAGGIGLWRDILRVLGKLLKVSSLPLLLYLLIMLPLSGLGFTSVITSGIAIPPFITGELLKTPTVAVIMRLGSLILLYVNIRFTLSIPLFALTDQSGRAAMRNSWKLTRGRAILPLAAALAVILIVAGIASLLLAVVALVPTAIADAVAPSASVVVAGFSMGFAQPLGVLLTSAVTAALLAALITMMDLTAPDLESSEVMPAAGSSNASRSRSLATGFVITVVILGGLVLGSAWVPTMQKLAEHPQTLVLGHRGFTDGGTENTIGGLEAAHAAGADLVEIDVMETKDGQFVVMHDSDLGRLAGIEGQVKDLTLAELTQITVRDSHGHEGLIPSVEEYVLRAAELEQPLLIEIKLGGADTPDHTERLLAELEELGVADRNIYHSLDYDSVETVKRLRPDLHIGYILAVAGVGLPETNADFVVIEEESANTGLQAAAEEAGLGFFVWTVNSEESQRIWLRQQADGMITDHPDNALKYRTEMQDEQGMAGILWDVLQSFVIVF